MLAPYERKLETGERHTVRAHSERPHGRTCERSMTDARSAERARSQSEDDECLPRTSASLRRASVTRCVLDASERAHGRTCDVLDD